MARGTGALAVLLLAATLSGCLAGSSEITARQAHDVALPLARGWQADAALAVALAPERARLQAGEGLDLRDGAVGDGRAAAWALVFVSATNRSEAFQAIVLANRSVHRAGPFPAEVRGGGPAGGANVSLGLAPARDWRVDSGAAVAAANAASERWRVLRPAAAQVELALFGAEGHDPVWGLWLSTVEGASRGNASDNRTAEVFVNATTGAVLAGPPPWWGQGLRVGTDLPVSQEQGGFDGTVTLASPSQGHGFEVERAGHPALRLRVEASLPAPGAAARVAVAAPDGRAAEATVGPGPADLTLADPAPGAYQVEVRLEGGALLPYRGCWVAEPRGLPAAPLPPGAGCP